MISVAVATTKSYTLVWARRKWVINFRSVEWQNATFRVEHEVTMETIEKETREFPTPTHGVYGLDQCQSCMHSLFFRKCRWLLLRNPIWALSERWQDPLEFCICLKYLGVGPIAQLVRESAVLITRMSQVRTLLGPKQVSFSFHVLLFSFFFSSFWPVVREISAFHLGVLQRTVLHAVRHSRSCGEAILFTPFVS